MHVYSSAYACIINEKTKGKIPGEYHVVWIGKQNIPAKKVYLSWRGGGVGLNKMQEYPPQKNLWRQVLKAFLPLSVTVHDFMDCIIALLHYRVSVK